MLLHTLPNDEDVCLFVRVKISERCHRSVVFGSKKVGGNILKSECVKLTYENGYKYHNIKFERPHSDARSASHNNTTRNTALRFTTAGKCNIFNQMNVLCYVLYFKSFHSFIRPQTMLMYKHQTAKHCHYRFFVLR